MRNPRWRFWPLLGPLRSSGVMARPTPVLLVMTFVLGLLGGMLVAVSASPAATGSSGGSPEGAAIAAPVNGAAAAQLVDGPVAAVDLGDGTVTAPYEVTNGVKIFNLRMAPVQWEVSPGVVKEAWTFNGTVPGPTIRINEGDRVRFIVQNDLPEETGVHWHGMELPNDQDGVPHITQHPIVPGETYTYEWTAISTGTHWYHSHMGGAQVAKGLYGALEVVPKQGDIVADRDYRVIVNDGGFLGFVLNGKSFPATQPLAAKVGERVRIRIIGSGPEMIHPVHLHGRAFELVAQDGNRLPAPVKMDTVNTGVGQTYDIVFVPPSPGKWLLHCHIFSHSETPTGMKGMVTYLDVTGGELAPGDAGLPGSPELPVVPEVPGVPGSPGAPGAPVLPEAPASPEAPESPGAPESPALPEAPRSPRSPALPGLPAAPVAS